MQLQLVEAGFFNDVGHKLVIGSGAACFAGTGIPRIRFPAEVNFRRESEHELLDALVLLDVFSWRKEYHAEDAGSVVDDGGWWSLDVEAGGKRVCSRGENAFPSYKAPLITSLREERLGLLRAAAFAALRLSVPFAYYIGNPAAERSD